MRNNLMKHKPSYPHIDLQRTGQKMKHMMESAGYTPRMQYGFFSIESIIVLELGRNDFWHITIKYISQWHRWFWTNSPMKILLTNAKAKANAAHGLPEIIEIATEKEHKENYKEKHNKDAKYGWYKYTSRFALPVYGEGEEIERYNVFRVVMIVRHAENEKMYLYDIMNIKKETSTLFQS